ncbi:hypothetical protein QMK54_10455 [Pseudomonas sp. P5_109]|uniref:HNH endonuclease n=1 Tax=Pseudomonas sp. P5_109 TaxID=3043441 RepID=UPI002A367AEC|nr:hypothetical protein [Pseudomonas sp. P5_109]WPN32135.1 hypothetical protein QMK54_10455 [Pseudomonas sp. P5_109]
MDESGAVLVGRSRMVSGSVYFLNQDGDRIHPIFQADKTTGQRSYRVHIDGGNEKTTDIDVTSEQELITHAQLGHSIRCLLPDGQANNRSLNSSDVVDLIVPTKIQMKNFWWVNHKKTHLDEYAGGYIWSPKKKRNGAANQTYLNLTLVSPGDIVVSYADGSIKAIGVASGLHHEEPIPESHWQAAEYWQELGWMVPIEWRKLDHPISPKSHIGVIAELLPEKYSPIKKNGNGNEGCFLASISPALGNVILELVAARDLKALPATQVTASAGGIELEKDISRLPAEQLRKVTPEYIWEAVQILLQGTHADGYRPSTDYDLLADDGVRLAPKQVFGLAATAALGKDIKPVHFTGGVGTVCFELLEAAGYKIVQKDEHVESVEIPTDTEERVWAEGQVKLVSHLKRERSPGLSKAKKASFIKKHGRLFCEECGTDPIEAYGDFGTACIEVHHEAVQVADMGDEHKTTLDQLRCLCANCHRIVHHRLKLRLIHSAVDSQNQGVPVSEAVA